jgi:hypothetical protein
VGWADGQLDGDEADAIVRTALEDGLELEEIAEIEQATKEPVAITDIDWRSMTKDDRLFVYAVASWMTRLDRDVPDAEIEALDRLGQALHLPERPREHADGIAREIAALPDGDAPDLYDIPKLRAVITERLHAAQDARDAQEPDATLQADGSTLMREVVGDDE